MLYTLREIDPPALPAVTLEEFKSANNVSHDEQDTIIEGYLNGARRLFEKYSGRTLYQKTLEVILPSWPPSNYIELPHATPLIEIVSVTYKDSDGDETVWSDAEYIADTDREPGRLVLAYGESWPSFTPYPVSPIRIQYTCGIVSTPAAEDIPDEIKKAIMLLAGDMLENGERELMSVRDKRILGVFQMAVDANRVVHEYSEL